MHCTTEQRIRESWPLLFTNCSQTFNSHVSKLRSYASAHACAIRAHLRVRASGDPEPKESDLAERIPHGMQLQAAVPREQRQLRSDRRTSIIINDLRSGLLAEVCKARLHASTNLVWWRRSPAVAPPAGSISSHRSGKLRPRPPRTGQQQQQE